MIIEITMVVIGILAHYLSEVIKNGKCPKRYWMEYRLNTFLSILGAVASTILLMYAGNVDLYTYLMAGYVADSVFNKSVPKSTTEKV